MPGSASKKSRVEYLDFGKSASQADKEQQAVFTAGFSKFIADNKKTQPTSSFAAVQTQFLPSAGAAQPTIPQQPTNPSNNSKTSGANSKQTTRPNSSRRNLILSRSDNKSLLGE